MRSLILVILLIISRYAFTQNILEVQIKNKENENLIGVKVQVNNKIVYTNINGFVNIEYRDLNDSIYCSNLNYYNYKTNIRTVINILKNKIILRSETFNLQEIELNLNRPITEKYAVERLDKFDIYFNPIAQNDVLKGISSLAYSTTNNQSAEISLRGSPPFNSNVILNGVPILNPVRADAAKQASSFSLFNPEIINNFDVYASNPPLTQGNTIGGLIDLRTVNSVEKKKIDIGVGLSNISVLYATPIKKKSNLIVYSNYGFSKTFIDINKDAFDSTLIKFSSIDFGLNFNTKFNNKVIFNTFQYFIQENSNNFEHRYNYTGIGEINNFRYFSVQNIKFVLPFGTIFLNNGIDISLQKYKFGNQNLNDQKKTIFNSIEFKKTFHKFILQAGIQSQMNIQNYKDSFPIYYYAVKPNNPNNFIDSTINFTLLESFITLNYDYNTKTAFILGIRKNLNNLNNNYTSFQFSYNYKPNSNNNFILGFGQYNKYNIPNYIYAGLYYIKNYQISIDYTYTYKNIKITTGIYYKKDEYPYYDINTLGIDYSIDWQINKHFNFKFANGHLSQKNIVNNLSSSGDYNLPFNLKIYLKYQNAKLGTFSLIAITRPGNYFTPFNSSILNTRIDAYQPIYSTNINREKTENYLSLDFTYSLVKNFSTNKTAVFYLNINNIFNIKSQQNNPVYNENYSTYYLKNFPSRIIYFGAVFTFY